MRRRLIHQTIFLDAQIDLGILLVSVIISLSAHLVTVADRKINDAAGSDGDRQHAEDLPKRQNMVSGNLPRLGVIIVLPLLNALFVVILHTGQHGMHTAIVIAIADLRVRGIQDIVNSGIRQIPDRNAAGGNRDLTVIHIDQ